MILDTVKNIDLYKSLSHRLALGLDYIANTDFLSLEMGTYQIDGDNVFAILQTYDTKNEANCRLESHQKYIDIQYMISGEELVGIAPLNNQEITENLLQDNDVVFYNGVSDKIRLTADNFMIFYPTDVHAPCIKVDKSIKVIKVVIKVAV